jgi:hypothetical protein
MGRVLSLLCGLAIALGASAAQAYLLEATWTQSIAGVAITVTNSGAACTDTNPAHVPGATSLTCPTAGLQAEGFADSIAAHSPPAYYNVSLTMPLFQMQAFTTGGTINIGTMATLQGAQSIIGNAVSAMVDVGIAGMVTVGGAQHTMASMWNQPLMGTLVQIPLSVGKAGVRTGSFTVLGSYHYITVTFYGWTLGTHTFTGLTSAGQPLPGVIAMGGSTVRPYFPGETMGVRAITLVAPSKISIDGPAAQRRTASFTSLRLGFHVDGIGLPEPGTLLLLAAGGLLLGFGWRPGSR